MSDAYRVKFPRLVGNNFGLASAGSTECGERSGMDSGRDSGRRTCRWWWSDDRAAPYWQLWTFAFTRNSSSTSEKAFVQCSPHAPPPIPRKSEGPSPFSTLSYCRVFDIRASLSQLCRRPCRGPC
ncbi:hypothetical protein GGP41_002963 [Bipolaris sorokiniana]|uniref:Uncharacterized protein n=1 Tax=Cochliobolus sativus TaxID=45130 RepID=A0A8H6DR53_COCSA|nr:hypothetical protein GGP41_002963 [Bipolaris sorokiniana]